MNERMALELCYLIEDLPASEQQTNISVKASELSVNIAKLQQQIDELKKVLKNKVEKVKEDIDDLEYADCYIEPWAIEDLKELKKHFDELLQILNKEERK